LNRGSKEDSRNGELEYAEVALDVNRGLKMASVDGIYSPDGSLSPFILYSYKYQIMEKFMSNCLRKQSHRSLYQFS